MTDGYDTCNSTLPHMNIVGLLRTKNIVYRKDYKLCVQSQECIQTVIFYTTLTPFTNNLYICTHVYQYTNTTS